MPNSTGATTLFVVTAAVGLVGGRLWRYRRDGVCARIWLNVREPACVPPRRLLVSAAGWLRAPKTADMTPAVRRDQRYSWLATATAFGWHGATVLPD